MIARLFMRARMMSAPKLGATPDKGMAAGQKCVATAKQVHLGRLAIDDAVGCDVINARVLPFTCVKQTAVMLVPAEHQQLTLRPMWYQAGVDRKDLSV
ncbi:MAG: hypothetical protein AAFU86_16055, partial [Pseudomonadota bacterium]